MAQRLRSAYTAKNLAVGKIIAEQLIDTLPSCPILEIARLGQTLKQWSKPFLAYFTTGRANNGGTEAINGLIELHRRIARGFRNRYNYRLRMLLIDGGLSPPPPQAGACYRTRLWSVRGTAASNDPGLLVPVVSF